MTAVPHSGNDCSGLCRMPCLHVGCWQCEARSITEWTGQIIGRLQSKYVAPEMFAALTPEDRETTKITRKALEGLAKRAGIEMWWNDGDPIFMEGGATKSTHERAIDVIPQSDIDAAARRIAAGAAQTMDEIVDDLLSQAKTDLTKDAERKAREILKEQGASDDDISAAEALLKGVPRPPSRPGRGNVINARDPRDAVKRITFVSTPDGTREMDAESIYDLAKYWGPGSFRLPIEISVSTNVDI
jgi:hypothetical protein